LPPMPPVSLPTMAPSGMSVASELGLELDIHTV